MLNWGILGCGGIADRRTMPAILSDPENRIAAVMDADGAVAERIAAKVGARKVCASVEELVTDPAVDAVYIATPVYLHRDMAAAAAAAGKHLLMEKPMALCAADAEAIVQAARAHGTQLGIGFQMRRHNLHEQMKTLIAQGGIGQLITMRAQFSCWYPDIPGAWRQSKALGGGGALMDLGVHCLDLMQFISGERFCEAKAMLATRTFQYEVEDCAALLLRTEAGSFAHVDVNFNLPDDAARSRLEFYGTAGSLIAEGTLGQTEDGTLHYFYAPQEAYSAMQNIHTVEARVFTGAGGNLYAKQIRDFTARIRAGRPDYTLAEETVRLQALVDSIYGSAGAAHPEKTEVQKR